MGGRAFSLTATEYSTRARGTGRELDIANENSKTESGATLDRVNLTLDGKAGVSAGRVCPSTRRSEESREAVSRGSSKNGGLDRQETANVVINTRGPRRALIFMLWRPACLSERRPVNMEAGARPRA